MKIIDCKQGSTEWSQARLGVVTASEGDALISPLWTIRKGEGVETYVCRKLCEKFLGWAPDTGGTWEMDQGNLIETIALPWFAFTHDVEPRRVGFCLSDDGRTGCSPDALIGDDCGLELKAPQPPTHLKYLLRDEVPPEYRAQVHFSMFVTGRPKWIFCSFSRQLPALVVHVQRDEGVQAAIHEAVAGFYAKFDPAYAKLCAARDAENALRKSEYEKANPAREQLIRIL
jgi:hypothetical protein